MLLKKNKGITLVALVITIVILLILAGISISALTNTGIFQKAKDAKSASENAERQEESKLAEYEDELSRYTSNDSWDNGVNKPELMTGMTAVNFEKNEITKVYKTNLNLENTNNEKNTWYNYEDKRWANAITKDNDGNITMIKSNVIQINEIISDVAVKIQNSINERGKENIKITIGSFTGSKLLSGRGPGIPIKISSIGNVETDLRSEFSAQGINQTLHRVYLQVDCEVSVLTPYNTISEKVSNQVLLIENVIVGKIPSTYYNLEGIDSSNAIDIIE